LGAGWRRPTVDGRHDWTGFFSAAASSKGRSSPQHVRVQSDLEALPIFGQAHFWRRRIYTESFETSQSPRSGKYLADVEICMSGHMFADVRRRATIPAVVEVGVYSNDRDGHGDVHAGRWYSLERRRLRHRLVHRGQQAFWKNGSMSGSSWARSTVIEGERLRARTIT